MNEIIFKTHSGLIYDAGAYGKSTIVCSDGGDLSVWKTVYPNLCHCYHANHAMRFLTSARTAEEAARKAVSILAEHNALYRRPVKFDVTTAL